MRPSSRRARAISIWFGAAVLVLTASLGAAAAHFAIDEAGDFLLRVDTYDHIAHHSRFIALLCALLTCGASVTVLLAAALNDARENRGELRAIVGTFARRTPWRLIASIAPLTVAALIGMESLDAWAGSGHLPSFISALGGSIALGLGIAVCVGCLAALALWRVLRLVCESHRTIASALEHLITVRDADGAAHPQFHLATVAVRPLAAGSVLASRSGKRAPPLAA